MRYAIIDLNLVKSDLIEKGQPPEQIDEIDGRISELEGKLSELEQQRAERFAGLNDELNRSRERLKLLEQQMALRFRHLYTQISVRRQSLRSAAAQELFHRLERCRGALALQRQQSRG